MALEPITRQEQIIAGKDLEPITRMEKFLKEYGGGGGEYFETVGGDTLTWDGNTEGLESVADTHYHVSDAIITKEDCANGLRLVVDGDDMLVGAEEAQGAFREDGFADLFVLAVIPYDNYTTPAGTIAPKGGIYFMGNADHYVSSITINGYTGFTTTKLKEEYLPSGATTFYVDTNEADTYLYVDSNRTTKATKSDVKKAIMAGAVNCYGDGLYFFPVVFGPADDAATLMIPAPGPDNTLMYIPYYTAEYTG